MSRLSRGLFVTFEGIDGVGKTTCLRKVAERLREGGADVLSTKLPGDAEAGSDIGAALRRLLFFDPSTKGLAPGVADMLFLADHVQCTERVIKPHLHKCGVVLCDRYADSQRAYSIHPSKKTPGWALDAYSTAATLIPDLTILLVGDPADMWARSKARVGDEASKQDGKAWEGATAQALIQGAYLGLLRHLPRTRIIEVDGLDAAAAAAAAYGHVREALDAEA
jgi:dTMP kinase